MTAIQKFVNSIQVGLETSHLQLLYFRYVKSFRTHKLRYENQNLHINWFSLETTKNPLKKRIVEVPKASWYRPMLQRFATGALYLVLHPKFDELEREGFFVALFE